MRFINQFVINFWLMSELNFKCTQTFVSWLWNPVRAAEVFRPGSTTAKRLVAKLSVTADATATPTASTQKNSASDSAEASGDKVIHFSLLLIRLLIYGMDCVYSAQMCAACRRITDLVADRSANTTLSAIRCSAESCATVVAVATVTVSARSRNARLCACNAPSCLHPETTRPIPIQVLPSHQSIAIELRLNLNFKNQPNI